MSFALFRKSDSEYNEVVIIRLQPIKKTIKDQAKARIKICNILLKDNIILN